jgi:hypothetical protein
MSKMKDSTKLTVMFPVIETKSVRRVYLILPVRNCSAEIQQFAENYVAQLESNGIKVHYPPRDVNQSEDGIGLQICKAHRSAMLKCDEVHIIWDSSSTGSHFDFGMVFMLNAFRKCPIIIAKPFDSTPHRSYGNVIKAIADDVAKTKTKT